MIQPPESNLKNTIRGNDTPGRSAHKHLHSKSMKHYSLMLALVAVAAAIVLGVILVLEQKRFFKVETSATLSYNPVTFSDKVYSPSISEVLQIVQADIVKKEAYDLIEIKEAKQKEKYLKKALSISLDLPSGSNSSNLLKVSVKWDDMEEARQLTDSYVKAAIHNYFRVRTNYLQEIQRKLLKVKQNKEAKIGTIEKNLSQLTQTVQAESLKAELEILKIRRNRQEEDLSDLQKQLETTLIHYEGMKTITPNKDKRQKIKSAPQQEYVLELVKKKNDALEDFEVQKATGKETDLQFKQAQIRYAFADDCLKSRLDELDLTEQDILNLDSESLNRMEEMETAEAGMTALNKHIKATQEALVQTQKQISDICKLLPQEEKLNEEQEETFRQINENDRDSRNIDSHIMMTVIELQSLGFINIHHITMFASQNYIFAILTGTIITTSLLSLIILVTELSRHYTKTPAKQ